MVARIRAGKTKNILDSSVDSALLAVEVYNKPRTSFRKEAFITLMINAWTKLIHAYLYQSIGDKYYFKKANGRYETVDGERKAWDLGECLDHIDNTTINGSVRANLKFFIGLRNKIEHRHISKSEIESLVFGECQALLYNFEEFITFHFGEDFALNENLAFSLQFSKSRTAEQKEANKSLLSKEVQEIKKYIETYRSNLEQNIFDSQEYSIKLIQIPKISNTNRGDLAIEFVRWNELDALDKANFDKVNAIIKDKVVKREAVNVGMLKASDVIRLVNEKLSDSDKNINHYDHKCLYYIFSIRPVGFESKDNFDTDTNYCHYDELHNDYIYQNSWVDLIAELLESNKLSLAVARKTFTKKTKLNLIDYLS